ncbi:MAG TPA: hypothetical protein VN285_03575 [Candidatus Deferrimicrobium sp.]|nr:hypothetical protein [Candidatus Deferrimicrobium sp.]
MRSFAALLLGTLMAASSLSSQELSTAVYPSEDELLEALQASEIDYYQFLILQEVISHGVDSTNSHLLDEIPNLSSLFSTAATAATSLENDQRAGFVGRPARRGGPVRRISHQYSQDMAEDGPSRYRTSCRIGLSKEVLLALNVHREFSGRERVVSRSLTFRNAEHIVREVTLGSFSRRLGLGTVFGYRGKLFEFADHLDGESLLFPDYGGFNGVYVRAVGRNLGSEVLTSVHRDQTHEMVTAGGSLSMTKLPFQPEVIVGVTRLSNRVSGQNIDDTKYAVSSVYDYDRGNVRMEGCGQAGERPSWGALVIEGRHYYSAMDLRYAAWAYSAEYLDLTGGSKAANIRTTDSIPEVEFSYSQKRAGQKGGLLKSVARLDHDLDVVSSFLCAGRNADTVNVQFLAGLVKRYGRKYEIRLDYLNKSATRVATEVSQRVRLEGRMLAEGLTARGYVAYTASNERDDYASVFVTVRRSWKDIGTLELWASLGRIDLEQVAVDYWYGYVKTEQKLFAEVSAGVKLSHRYDRQAGEQHRSVILVEVTAWL